MYYLRTKAAVDAIKFTLDNTKKKEVPVAEAVETEVVAAAATISQAVQSKASVSKVSPQAELDIEPMSPQEMKEMIARAKEGQADDDCLMCGS